MSALVHVDSATLVVPGLRFWAKRWTTGRISLICSNENGAAELWTEERWMNSADRYQRELGGVELHSPRPPSSNVDAEPTFSDCDVLPGGRCWNDGSLMAYSKTFLPMIDGGDHAGVLRELAEWHTSRFGEVSS